MRPPNPGTAINRVRFSQALRASPWRWLRAILFAWGTCIAAWPSLAAEPDAAALLLRSKYTEFTSQLRHNQYQRALHLVSVESSHALKGEIYAVVDYPFATVKQALYDPAHWCDVLILHVNIKYCHASRNVAGTILTVDLGKKDEQALADAYRVDFNYHGIATTRDYFALQLDAGKGPLGTHDYRIWVDATQLADGRTFLHFTYSYGFGLAGRLALQSYLTTLGRDKVGFTRIGRKSDGQPAYIQGVRGVVERNTMRYYLAIDAYLATLKSQPEDQLEQRLQHWYDGTDRYARQLHEIGRQDYLAMKRKEYQRQQVVQ